MKLDQLLTAPLPVNRVARRVVKQARPEDVWLPQPKPAAHYVGSSNALPIIAIPAAVPAAVRDVVGRKRDRMTVIGYAAHQPENKQKKGAVWVVRCDCGTYEHRRNILRWLHTLEVDSCRECQRRRYLLNGSFAPARPPAKRLTKDAAAAATQPAASAATGDLFA
jgi:hypothetical protein